MDEFYCGNKTCIPIGWACDGIDDCGDNSDEIEACYGIKFHRVLVLDTSLNIRGIDYNYQNISKTLEN